MDGWMNGRMDRWMYRWIDRWMMDGWWMDDNYKVTTYIQFHGLR